MKEEPILFGSDLHLLGMLSRPVSGMPANTACLMLNVGVTHRIGPHRVNVKLARRLAQQGVVSLRFDLSGIGDSPAPRNPAHFRAQAVLDMQAAMDRVQALTGIRRFVVFGVCSGAMNGYSLALADERVVGLMMFDGYAFPSRRAQWARNWHRLCAMPFNPAIAGKTWRWVKRLAERDRTPQLDIFAEDDSGQPNAQAFGEALVKLQARGVSLYLVYSGTLHATDSGYDQLGAFAGEPFLKQLRYEFMGDVDHTVLAVEAQRKLVGAVADWVATVTGRAPLSAPATAPQPRANRLDTDFAAHGL